MPKVLIALAVIMVITLAVGLVLVINDVDPGPCQFPLENGEQR